MIPVVGSTGPDGLKLSRGRLINYYVEVIDGKPALLPTPVREKWLDVGSGPIRGMEESAGNLVVVSGTGVFKIDAGGHMRSTGSVSGQFGRAPMATNGFNTLLADNGRLYVVDGDATRLVDDVDAPRNVIDVQFADGFYVAVDGAEDRFYIPENTYDAVNWNALDFAASEFAPDRLKRLFRNKGVLWAFDERSITPFANTGNVDFPYEPIKSAVSHFGIEAPDSIARVGGTVGFLGRNEDGGRVVYALGGGADPQRVSDPAIEKFLSSLDTVEDAYAYGLTYRGHDWYCLTLPAHTTHGITLVKDLTTGVWFEWSTLNESPDRRGRFMATDHVYFAGMHLVADGNTLYKLTAPPIQTNMELRVMRNGKHWGYSRSKSLGTLGQIKRPIWRRLGTGRRWSFWLRSTSDDVCDGDVRVLRERILDTISQDDRNIRFGELYLDIESGHEEIVIRGGNLR